MKTFWRSSGDGPKLSHYVHFYIYGVLGWLTIKTQVSRFNGKFSVLQEVKLCSELSRLFTNHVTLKRYKQTPFISLEPTTKGCVLFQTRFAMKTKFSRKMWRNFWNLPVGIIIVLLVSHNIFFSQAIWKTFKYYWAAHKFNFSNCFR